MIVIYAGSSYFVWFIWSWRNYSSLENSARYWQTKVRQVWDTCYFSCKSCKNKFPSIIISKITLQINRIFQIVLVRIQGKDLLFGPLVLEVPSWHWRFMVATNQWFRGIWALVGSRMLRSKTIFTFNSQLYTLRWLTHIETSAWWGTEFDTVPLKGFSGNWYW